MNSRMSVTNDGRLYLHNSIYSKHSKSAFVNYNCGNSKYLLVLKCITITKPAVGI